VEVLHAGHPFVYLRGGRYLVVINPQEQAASCSYDGARAGAPLEADGVTVSGSTITAEGFGYGILDLGTD
jgi:maltose alpha-D-glucosyltransferase/alpha-amylase